MPTLSGEFLMGSADMAGLDRRIMVLPCSVCSAPGPHAHRIEREHGFTVICRRCRNPQVAEDPGQNDGDMFHARSIAAPAASSESLREEL